MDIWGNYIELLIADVLEQTAIADCIVLILLIADNSNRILDHIIVDIELIDKEVDIDQDTEPKGQPSLHIARIEIQPFHDSRQHDVKDRNFVDFVQEGVELAHMLLE